MQLLIQCEIARHVFTMLPWRNEGITEQRWILVEKGDGNVILVDNVMTLVLVACDDLTDEATSALRAANVGVNVKRASFDHLLAPLVHVPSLASYHDQSPGRVIVGVSFKITVHIHMRKATGRQ